MAIAKITIDYVFVTMYQMSAGIKQGGYEFILSQPHKITQTLLKVESEDVLFSSLKKIE